jgi:hypothetical protein
VRRLRRILEQWWKTRIRRRRYLAQLAEAEAILERARDRKNRQHLRLMDDR